MTRNDNTGHPCLVPGMSRPETLFMSIDWRASLVPTAALIPAPIAYIKVVAVRRRSFRVMMLFARLVRKSPMILKNHLLVATGLKPQASGLWSQVWASAGRA